VLAAAFHPHAHEREVLSAGANKTLAVTRYARFGDHIDVDVGGGDGSFVTSSVVATLPAPVLCVNYNFVHTHYAVGSAHYCAHSCSYDIVLFPGALCRLQSYANDLLIHRIFFSP
jgi:hypothetical protein